MTTETEVIFSTSNEQIFSSLKKFFFGSGATPSGTQGTMWDDAD